MKFYIDVSNDPRREFLVVRVDHDGHEEFLDAVPSLEQAFDIIAHGGEKPNSSPQRIIVETGAY